LPLLSKSPTAAPSGQETAGDAAALNPFHVCPAMYGAQQTDKKPTISAVMSHDASAGRGQVRKRP
jgi:hypothetical protein